jgi:hypothetical protein
MPEIDVIGWGGYLRAFDDFLAARTRGDAIAAMRARRKMRSELELDQAVGVQIHAERVQQRDGDLADREAVADVDEWGHMGTPED